MDALASLDDIAVVDLQWEPMPDKRPWIRTVCDLRLDSRGASGCDGRRKPIASDVMRALAALAERGGYRYFMYVNSDIVVTAAALTLVRSQAKEAYAFSRLEVDPETGGELETTLGGLDAFAFEVRWWQANHQRFRPYVLGEALWDNVYAALAMCHADGLLALRGEIRHERHPTEWGQSAFADFNGYLAAVDARYFSLWCAYHEQLLSARARGASADEERALSRNTFVWRPSASAAVRQIGRNVTARLSYRRKRARWIRMLPEAGR